MRRHGGRGDGNSLMQIAAAVVGSAAASQVINPPHSRESACDETCNHVDPEDGPQGGSHPDGEPYVPPTADDLKAQEDSNPYPEPGCMKRTGNASNFCMLEAGHEGACDDEPNPDLLREIARLRARVAELEQAEVTRELNVHQALNTYEVDESVPPGVEQVTPNMQVIVGANHRRLIARWMDEGVWVGGCLIADWEHAEALASFITREDEGE